MSDLIQKILTVIDWINKADDASRVNCGFNGELSLVDKAAREAAKDIPTNYVIVLEAKVILQQALEYVWRIEGSCGVPKLEAFKEIYSDSIRVLFRNPSTLEIEKVSPYELAMNGLPHDADSGQDMDYVCCEIRCTTADEISNLKQKYGGHNYGAHPNYPIEDWMFAVKQKDTRLGYWEWVREYMRAESLGVADGNTG